MNRGLAKHLARSIDTIETKIDRSKERGAIKLSAEDAAELNQVLRNAFMYVAESNYDSLAGSLARVMRE